MRIRFGLLAVVTAMVAAGLLVVGAGSAAAAITVNCPGDDLQSAIDNAPQFATITINGTCYGNFTTSFLNGTNFGELTLQGGSAGATLDGRGSGTVLYIDGGDVTVRNLTITNGNAGSGGGVFLLKAALTMTNSTIRGNRADFGGGMDLVIGYRVDLTGVTVTRNTATYRGGGIVLDNTALSMSASTVSLNTSTGTGQKYGGGGIEMEYSDAVLTSTRVTANGSADYGGGIADYGGQLEGETSLPMGLSLINSSVDHNVAADDGGGIYNESSEGDAPAVLQGTTVSFNKASDGDGGGIANYGECGDTASVLATGSTFQGNQARNGEGGAVYNAAGEDGCLEAGTGLVTIAQSPTANGRSVVNSNQAMYGGGFGNEQYDGVASLTLQPGATVRGNKASKTGGGVWNDCGSFSSLGQILLNTPNNVVSGCF